MDYEKTARQFRKRKLFDVSNESSQVVDYDQEDIKRILPHRAPFLLVDSINAIDIINKCIMGQRHIQEDDLVFNGHFPDYPIYPGVLHVEMAGQLGICLHHFLTKNSSVLSANVERVDVRLVKILYVLFQYEVLPGDDLTIICKELESDEYKSMGISQIIKNDQVCTVSIAELYKT
ncbi:3-hydroxyacyl-ACP dehydratase FabZ family protein [Candidatus Latescibacterota bacterium]